MRVRFSNLDCARGAAVLLMVLDHVLVVVEGYEMSAGRMVTRAAMPTFAVLVGVFAERPLSSRRRWQWVAAAVVAYPLYAVVGLGGPLLLVWLGLGRWGVRTLERTPAIAAGLVVVVLTLIANGYPPGLASPGSEYHPVAIVGLVAVGRLLGPERLSKLVGEPDRRLQWLGVIGRMPLAVYLGHLVALAGLTLALG